MISVNNLEGFGVGAYDLVTGPNAIVGGATLFTGLMPGGYTYAFDTTTDPTVLTLVVSAAAAGDLYWTGDAFSLSWRDVGAGNSNWSTTSNGATEAGFSPGAGNTAIFNSGAGAIDVTLDGTTSAKGLVMTATAGGPLTINPGINNGSLSLGTDGIDIETGAPNALTIAAAAALNGVQTWNVADSGTLLTIGGILSGGQPDSDQTTPGTSVSLTITGAGAVTFDNAGNTFTGDIRVDGGGLVINNVRDWGGPTVASTTSKTIILDDGRLYVTASVNPTTLALTSYNLLKIEAGGGAIDVADGFTLTLDDPGQLFGSGALTKTGTGTLALGEHHSAFGGFTGTLDITAGTLQLIDNSGGFGTVDGGTTIQSGAALNLNARTVGELEPLTISGDGLASNPQGVIYNSSGTAATFSGPITLGGNVSLGGPNTFTLNGVIGGDFALTKVGAGRVNLGAANEYTGVTTIAAGELTLTADASTLGTTAAGTVVQDGAALRIHKSMTLDENLTLTGTGVGDTGNTYGALLFNLNSGTWTLGGSVTLDGGAAINAYNSGVATITVSQGIGGAGGLELRSGAANNGDAIYILNAQSTYTGDTVFSTFNSRSVKVQSGIDNALPTGTVLKLQATSGTTTFGKFILNGFNQEVAGIEGAVAANTLNSIVGGAETLSTLTVNNTADFTYDGRLGNTGANEDNLALVKKGAGKLTLTDANTYIGGTTIEAGTLTLGESGSLGAGAVRVNTGATLDVSAKTGGLIVAADSRIVGAGGTVTGDLILQSGAYLSLVLVGNAPLSLTVSGAVTLDAGFGIGSLKNAAGGDLDWSLISNGNYALIDTASTFDHISNFGAGNAADIGSGRSAYFDNGSLQLYVIPEPASLGTLGILAIAALLRRRLRR